MGRAQDLARVAKGAGKVAQALLDAEGPVVAARCLKLRDHGVGLGTSLKDAVSSAVSSAHRPTQPPPANSGTRPDSEKAGSVSAPTSNGDNDTVTFPSPSSNGNGLATNSTPTPPKLSKEHPTFHSQQPQNPEATFNEEYIPLDRPAALLESAMEVETAAKEEPPREQQHESSYTAGQEAERHQDGAGGGSTAAVDSLPGGAKVEITQDCTTMKASPKVSWDHSGPWTFASPGGDDSAGDGDGGGVRATGAGGGGASQVGARNGGMSGSRTRAVPSSPLARVFGFGQLAAGLAIGTVAEAVRQSVGVGGAEGRGGPEGANSQGSNVTKYVVSDANAERLAETLCRMRGAALKLGQMLSIQDESVIPRSLSKALDRVRQGADVMPVRQLNNQLVNSFGANWRSRLSSFDETPIAAASIGQVHRAKLLDGTEVAMKIQYPGVADSVESDLTNLHRLVKMTNIIPPGLYIEEIIKVAREELTDECDYEREAVNQERFRVLVESDPSLNKWASVPRVVPELLSKEVLTTHLVTGVPVDQVLPMPQEVRNHVARLMLRCTINELFDWRFMQTDPNWGNFLFDRNTGKMSLIDFGACREYRKDFVDDYLRLVWAAANRDGDEIMRVSQELQFLTGDESASMLKAHLEAGLVVGEPFVDRAGGAFDFHGSNITARLSQHGDTFMKHRLTPPPREAYSLHRKLAGAFLLNIKLKATIPCRDILEEVHDRYTFG